jgi:hypothetical protein
MGRPQRGSKYGVRVLDSLPLIHIYSSQDCPPGGGRIGYDREPLAEGKLKRAGEQL